MLSPSDAQVAARDSQLQGLPILLDPPALLELLRQHLPDAELKGIQCTYLRYKPETNCLASYQLETSLGEIDLYAKAYTTKDADKLGKITQKPSTSALGPGALHLDQYAIGLRIFPNDDSLESLRLLATDAGRRRLLKKLLPQIEPVSAHSIRRLAYKPERRFVAQLLLDGRPHAVLRFYREEDFFPATRNAKLLKSGQVLRVSERLGRSTQHHVTAVRWLHGTLLGDILSNESSDSPALQFVGHALAELHTTDSHKLPLKTRKMEVEALHQSIELAAFLCPQLADPLAELANGLGEYLLEQPRQHACVHGDLHPRQIVLLPDGVALIDLDEAYSGDPAADFGNLLAHLWRQAPNHLHIARTALLGSYETAGGAIDPGHIDLYTAAGLLRMISDPFRQREVDWPQRIEVILQHARSLFSIAAAHRPQSSGVCSDSRMPFLADATDPAKVATLFKENLPWPARLLSLRVIRYKPQRRCLIEYDLQTADGRMVTLVGKARAKGLDAKTFHLQQQLWQAGFDDKSEDGISVPEPVASIPSLRMWLQRRVAGVRSIGLLAAHGESQLSSRLAEGIFKLHQCSVHPARSHTMLDELRILQEKLPLVGQRYPHLQERLQRLLEMCGRIGESCHVAPVCPIHRDFYHDQVMVDATRLHLLDLDLFAMGDPALDMGNFIGHLSEYALRKLGGADALARQQEAMTERYLQLAGEQLRPRIVAYSALTLARLIYISTLFNERTSHTQSLVSLCEQRFMERDLR